MSKQDDTDKGLPSKNELSDNTSTESRTELRLLPLLMKFFKLSGIGLAVWLVGYTKFSFLWIVIALFLYVSNLEYKKLKANRRLYTQQATRNEQEAISARLSDLPSWVKLVADFYVKFYIFNCLIFILQALYCTCT